MPSTLTNDPEASHETLNFNLEPNSFTEPGPPPKDGLINNILDPTNNSNPFFSKFYPGASHTLGIGQTFMDAFVELRMIIDYSQSLSAVTNVI